MSVNIVNKTTGDLTRVAGNATDKVGNLNALTTTDKTSIVGGVNEINKYFVNLGTISGADLSTFVKNACIAFRALNPKVNKPHNVTLVWSNNRYTGNFIFFNDVADVTIFGGGSKIYSGGYNFQSDKVVVHTYSEDVATYGSVDMISTYYVGDWVFSRLGNMRILYTTDLKDIPTGTTVVGYIPEGDRPARDFYYYIYSYNKQTTFMLHFALNGAITINNETGQAISGNIWLNDNIVYNV